MWISLKFVLDGQGKLDKVFFAPALAERKCLQRKGDIGKARVRNESWNGRESMVIIHYLPFVRNNNGSKRDHLFRPRFSLGCFTVALVVNLDPKPYPSFPLIIYRVATEKSFPNGLILEQTKLKTKWKK